jgi:hypothetical protein
MVRQYLEFERAREERLAKLKLQLDNPYMLQDTEKG